MAVPSLVREMCGAYLEAVDDARPGLVTGLYLVGSVALGGFSEDRSNVDFIAVTSRLPDGDDLAGLVRAHRAVAGSRSRPHFDGVYVRAADLSRPPEEIGARVSAHGGSVVTDRDDEPDPVSLYLLSRHGVAVRGPDVADLGLREDADSVRRWLTGRLESHWVPWLDRFARRWAPMGLSGRAVQRGVLGLPRLHCTLATGELTTKEEAGRYASRTFGREWDEILDEALRLRVGGRGTTYRTPMARRRDATAFMGAVVAGSRRVGAAGA